MIVNKPDDIKVFFRDGEGYMIHVCLYAVYQDSIGKSRGKLDILYDASYKQITNWVHRFDKNGIEGLRIEDVAREQLVLVKSKETESVFSL